MAGHRCLGQRWAAVATLVIVMTSLTGVSAQRLWSSGFDSGSVNGDGWWLSAPSGAALANWGSVEAARSGPYGFSVTLLSVPSPPDDRRVMLQVRVRMAAAGTRFCIGRGPCVHIAVFAHAEGSGDTRVPVHAKLTLMHTTRTFFLSRWPACQVPRPLRNTRT